MWNNTESRIYQMASGYGIPIKTATMCQFPLIPLRANENRWVPSDTLMIYTSTPQNDYTITIRAAACHSLFSLSYNIIHMYPFVPLFFHTFLHCDVLLLLWWLAPTGWCIWRMRVRWSRLVRKDQKKREDVTAGEGCSTSLCDWLTVSLSNSADWLIDWLIFWLVDWLIALLIDSLTD